MSFEKGDSGRNYKTRASCLHCVLWPQQPDVPNRHHQLLQGLHYVERELSPGTFQTITKRMAETNIWQPPTLVALQVKAQILGTLHLLGGGCDAQWNSKEGASFTCGWPRLDPQHPREFPKHSAEDHWVWPQIQISGQENSSEQALRPSQDAICPTGLGGSWTGTRV